MQSASARPQQPALHHRRIILLGLALGLLLALLLEGTAFQRLWLISSEAGVAVGALLYLLFPALEGFLTARQGGDSRAGTRSGRWVGGIGIIPPAIDLVAHAVIWLVNRPECSSIACGLFYSPQFILAITLYSLLLQGMGSVLGGLLGGWLGGQLGQRWAKAAGQRGEPEL